MAKKTTKKIKIDDAGKTQFIIEEVGDLELEDSDIEKIQSILARPSKGKTCLDRVRLETLEKDESDAAKEYADIAECLKKEGDAIGAGLFKGMSLDEKRHQKVILKLLKKGYQDGKGEVGKGKEISVQIPQFDLPGEHTCEVPFFIVVEDWGTSTVSEGEASRDNILGYLHNASEMIDAGINFSFDPLGWTDSGIYGIIGIDVVKITGEGATESVQFETSKKWYIEKIKYLMEMIKGKYTLRANKIMIGKWGIRKENLQKFIEDLKGWKR